MPNSLSMLQRRPNNSFCETTPEWVHFAGPSSGIKMSAGPSSGIKMSPSVFMVDRPLGREVFRLHSVHKMLPPASLKVIYTFMFPDMAYDTLPMWEKIIIYCSEMEREK